MASENKIVIYGMSGSQYVGKVLTALDARNVKHYVKFVSVDPKERVKELPSQDGSILVPEMTFNDTVVKDSEAILHFLDDKLGTNYFPPGSNASELSTRVDGGIALYVNYYNWVYPPGHQRSLRARFKKAIPWFMSLVAGPLIDYLIKSKKAEFTKRVMDNLKLSEQDLKDEPKVRENMIVELEFYQSLFKSEDQQFFLPGEQPSAADFSVYAQMQRLVGNMGDGGWDGYAGIPELAKEPRLKRLFVWYDMMCAKFPMIFKGKRDPDEKKGGKSPTPNQSLPSCG